MNRSVSIIGRLAELRIMQSFKLRGLVFGVATSLFLILSFFPERFHAMGTLTPTDPESFGLSGTLGQLGAFNSVFGNQAAVEIALRVANSPQVRGEVIKNLDLQRRMNEPNVLKVHRWLQDKMVIRSLRGGIVLIELEDRDGVLARDLVAAYTDATRDRLAEIARSQTAYKRKVLLQLSGDATRQLAEAQSAFDDFRFRNRAPAPLTTVAAVSERIPELEAAIKAKQVEIASARQFYTDTNPVMRQLSAQLQSLQADLAQVRTTDPSADLTVGRAVNSSSQYFKLERNLAFARSLYDSYLRYLQGTAVEDLTSTASVRVLEPAYVDTKRQIWFPALAGAIITFLLWLSIEFYRLRPPIGGRLGNEGI